MGSAQPGQGGGLSEAAPGASAAASAATAAGAGADLPHIDEHAVAVDAAPERVWPALGEVLSRSFSAPGSRPVGRALGVRPLDPRGSVITAGGELRGFRVARAEPGMELALEGRHRFSRYALIFRIDDLGSGRSRLRAETRAAFPGPAGQVYKTLVIRTRGHVLAVRRMLGATKRRAERAPA